MNVVCLPQLDVNVESPRSRGFGINISKGTVGPGQLADIPDELGKQARMCGQNGSVGSPPVRDGGEEFSDGIGAIQRFGYEHGS